MSAVINVAIAGFGLSARVFHLPFLMQDKRFNIVKVYERQTEKAKKVINNVEVVHCFEQLLTDEVDLVLISTPNQTHFELAKQAILAKKNVVVEKPLAITQSEALELINLSKAQNVLLTVYQNRRWDNALVTAKEIIQQNLLGELVDCEIRFERYAKQKNAKVWKETGEKGTGLVYDLGVHLIDQAVYLFGKPAEVYADIRYQHTDVISDDNFNIIFYYDSGFRVYLTATKYAREPSHHFILHGKLGSYRKTEGDPQESLLNQGIIPNDPDWNSESEEKWGILHTEDQGQVIRKPYPTKSASYQYFYDNLYLALNHQAALEVTPEQASEVLYLIDKVYESATLGKRIAV